MGSDTGCDIKKREATKASLGLRDYKQGIPKKESSFVKAIQDEPGRLRKGEVYVPIKKPPVISRSAKVTPGSVFAECKAFAKRLKKGKRSTLEW